jgi:hypothetical protein
MRPGLRPLRLRQEAWPNPLAAVPGAGPIHLVIDSTGLRVHTGNRHKPPNQRPWRKLHIAVDERTGQVAAAELTASDNHDSMLIEKLLKHNGRGLVSFTADGAYDTETVYEAVAQDAERRGSRDAARPDSTA